MLVLTEVGVCYQHKPIVAKVSLKIGPREIHALMGPNGSGKSSLSLALAGHPDYSLTTSSKLEIDGVDLRPKLPHERARAGLFLTFQNPVAIPGIPVKQMLRVMVDLLGDKPVPILDFNQQLDQWVEQVGVKPELLERSVHEGFSGGEKKRLEMLMLLMAKPKYAILDEIDSGLDVDAIRTMAQAIQTAQKEFGTGLLMVTHYRRILEYLKVKTVHVLAKGNIVKTGGPELIEQIETNGYKGLT